MSHYGFSASAFADKIEVQRSSISHILSGRNKPSLDFVMKVLSAFPEVDLYWLLNGKGSFPSNEAATPQPQNVESVAKKLSSSSIKDVTIERIVVFYTDGSFKSYENTN